VTTRLMKAPPIRNLGGRALGALRSPLYGSGYALLANTAGTTLVGFVYWAIAAHLYNRQALGRGAALVSALLLVSNVAQLNLHNALPRFLPRAGRSACRFITYGYGASSLIALVLGLAFVTILPRLNMNWRFLGDSASLTVLFVAGTVVWGVFNLEDAALVGLHRSVIVPIENVVYGVFKLVLLVGIAVSLPSTGIFTSWIIPLVLIVPVINWLIFNRYLKDRDFPAATAGLRPREVIRFASIDYVGALIGQAYVNLLPLLVLSTLGAAANGIFYIAWTIAAALSMVTFNFAWSLLVEGATAPHRLPELTRGVLIRCAVFTIPGVALLIVAANPILRIYGSAYADHASLLLGLLALSAIPIGLVNIVFTLDRLAGRVSRAALYQGVLAVFILGGSWVLLKHLGINGVGLGCLAGSLAVAIIRFPTILDAVRPRADSAPVPSPVRRWLADPALRIRTRLQYLGSVALNGAVKPQNLMTIKQAFEAGLTPEGWQKEKVNANWRAAKHRARLRGRGIDIIGTAGNEPLYDAVELSDFLEELTATTAETEEQHGSSVSTVPEAIDREPVVTSLAPPGEGSQRRGLTTLGLSALFGASLILIAIGYPLNVGVLRLIGVLGAVFFGVGTVPLQLSERSSLAMRLGVAGVVGMSVLTLAGSVMVLTPLWHPLAAAVIVGAIAVSVHVQACRRALAGLHGSEVFRSLGFGWRTAFDISIACTVSGTVLWCYAAVSRGYIVPGIGGFLPVISPLWYAGLVLLLAGIVLARGKSEVHAMSALVSLVAALTLTPALVYGLPRSQSAAKHVDLVQLILSAHHLDPAVNIYEAYSGFFSAVAWVCDLAGIHSSIGLATCWPFVVGLVGLAELRFFFGQLINSSYRIWVGMTLVVLVNAIGQDYFSPQSVGFVLVLGVYGLALGDDWPGLSNRMRIALLVFAGCSLAVTHELSPYVASGVLIILVIFRAVRPWYIPATCLLPAILWAVFNGGLLTHYVTLHDIGDLSNFTPPKTIATPGLQRLPIVDESSHALLLGLLVLISLAAVGFARTRRRPQTWGFMISSGWGLIIISLVPYSQEGIFRAALFGIPWLVLVAMEALPSSPPRWTSVVFGAVSVGLLGTYLVAMFGLDNADVIRPGDLQAFQFYQTHAPASSYLLSLGYGDLPVSATFPQPHHFIEWTNVVTKPTFGVGRPNAADAETLAREYVGHAAATRGPARDLYAIWSPASAVYGVDYGLATLAHAKAWLRVLEASPDWQVVFNRDGTYLFRVVVHPTHAESAVRTTLRHDIDHHQFGRSQAVSRGS
jgi:O-antigen/teichoic acid export membrane protein